jgi:hypothetical protein
VFVTVRERGNYYTPTDKSTRALLIFGMDGKQQHTYQYDSNKHRLFTLPRRITTNNNKDIVVVDSTSDYTGRVEVVGREGEVLLYELLLRTVYYNPPIIVPSCHCQVKKDI